MITNTDALGYVRKVPSQWFIRRNLVWESDGGRCGNDCGAAFHRRKTGTELMI